MFRQSRVAAVLALVILAATACGSTSPSQPGAATTKPTSQQSAQPAAAKPAAPTTVKIAVASKSITFSPLYLAIHRGYFKQAGLDVKLIPLRGMTETVTALKAGDVQFDLSFGGSVVLLALKGVTDLLGVGVLNNTNTMQFAIGKAGAQAAHLQAGWPLARRLRLLKGLTIGTVTNTAAEMVVRYGAQIVGLRPQQYKIISIGGVSQQVAALTMKQVDGIIYPPPTVQLAEKDHAGTLLFSGSELPKMNDIVNPGIVVTRAFAQKQPALIRKVLHAIAQSTTFMRAHPHQTAAILGRTEFSSLNPAILAAGLKVYQSGWQSTLKASPAMWQNSVLLLEKGGLVTPAKVAKVNLQRLWTNRYLQ